MVKNKQELWQRKQDRSVHKFARYTKIHVRYNILISGKLKYSGPLVQEVLEIATLLYIRKEKVYLILWSNLFAVKDKKNSLFSIDSNTVWKSSLIMGETGLMHGKYHCSLVIQLFHQSYSMQYDNLVCLEKFHSKK